MCKHANIIKRNGDVICHDCGEVLEKDFASDLYIMNKIGEPRQSQSNSRQYVEVGNIVSKVNNTGSTIEPYDLKYLPPENNKLFKRLALKDKYEKNKCDAYKYQILDRLSIICKYLGLPNYIKHDAAYRYRKIIKFGKVINNVSCLCFCIWDSIRHFKYKTNLKELIKAFKDHRSRVSGRSMIRDGCLYSEYLRKSGVKKSNPKDPEDYMPRHFAELSNHYELLEERLIFKGQPYISVKEYLAELERTAYKLLKVFHNSLKHFNPFNLAASCIYSADLLMSKINNHKQILTQGSLSNITKVHEYSIRDIYVKFFKERIKRIKGVCILKWQS